MLILNGLGLSYKKIETPNVGDFFFVFLDPKQISIFESSEIPEKFIKISNFSIFFEIKYDINQ